MGRIKTKLKLVCAWCSRDMGEVNGQGVEGVSHDLCEECEKKLMTIPEPYALKVRSELRTHSTQELLEAHKALQCGKAIGLKILEQVREHAPSAIREILWERGRK